MKIEFVEIADFMAQDLTPPALERDGDHELEEWSGTTMRCVKCHVIRINGYSSALPNEPALWCGEDMRAPWRRKRPACLPK